MTDDSYITIRDGISTSYVGDDAVALFRAKVLLSSLQLYSKSGIFPTRKVTLRKMLDIVEQSFTHKHYKRTQIERAVYDLSVWHDNMLSAMPIEVQHVDASDVDNK